MIYGPPKLKNTCLCGGLMGIKAVHLQLDVEIVLFKRLDGDKFLNGGGF